MTRPTRLYVCGPMTGLPEKNYPMFNDVSQRLRDKGYAVLNPVDVDQQAVVEGEIRDWGWYMRHTLRMLLAADAVALLPGWENSKGAQLEVHIAEHLEMDVCPAVEWLRDNYDPATAEPPC